METLESLVIEAFSSVPNNGLPQDDFKKFTGLAFNMSEFKKLYWVKPVKDVHQVGIDSCFQFPLLTSAASSKNICSVYSDTVCTVTQCVQ